MNIFFRCQVLVGIIFSLEVSRISRGNRNWYHLLDICAITHTLIADAEGLYAYSSPKRAVIPRQFEQ